MPTTQESVPQSADDMNCLSGSTMPLRSSTRATDVGLTGDRSCLGGDNKSLCDLRYHHFRRLWHVEGAKVRHYMVQNAFSLRPCRCKDKNPLCDWHGVSSQGVDDSEPHRCATSITHVLHSWMLEMGATIYQPAG